MSIKKSIFCAGLVVFSLWALANIGTSSIFFNKDKNDKDTAIATEKLTENIDKKKSNNSLNKEENLTEELKIFGLSKTIELNEIKDFWYEFYQDDKVHNLLKIYPKKIYVVYQNINSSFSQAKVTIGYKSSSLKKQQNYLILSKEKAFQILSKDQYSEKEMIDSWQKINFAKEINYLLEIHYLNKSNNITATEFFVFYK